MLKKAASGVLAGHCRLTISAARTNLAPLIRDAVRLAAVLLDSFYKHPELPTYSWTSTLSTK